MFAFICLPYLASHIADHPAGFGGLSHNTIGAASRSKDSDFWHVRSQRRYCMPLLQVLTCQHIASCQQASCVVGDWTVVWIVGFGAAAACTAAAWSGVFWTGLKTPAKKHIAVASKSCSSCIVSLKSLSGLVRSCQFELASAVCCIPLILLLSSGRMIRVSHEAKIIYIMHLSCHKVNILSRRGLSTRGSFRSW